MLFRIAFAIIMGWASNSMAWQRDMNSAFNYDAYYHAFSTEDTILFNRQLEALVQYSGIKKDAFYGAILMKKSKSLPTIRLKLDTFKDGRDLLENSIGKDPQNLEFRFLRLATQENAPGFLNYDNNKKEDALLIINSFGDLSTISRKYIREYAKVSGTLKPEDLK